MVAATFPVARKPVKSRRDRGSTQVAILNEAERLIAEKGVNGFTLEEIAMPLKVRVPSLYKHYASRDEVLIEVSRRFISALSLQFALPAGEAGEPWQVLRHACDEFVGFHVANPAYVRLSLVDLATPKGGLEYVKRAAGGPFRANFRSGPLAPMYRRLAKLLAAGREAGEFRAVEPLAFYRLIKSALLIQLVFPKDQLLSTRPGGRVRRIQLELWDLVTRYLIAGDGPASAVTRRPGRQS